MEKLQKEILKQYTTVNQAYSPDKVKQAEGKVIRSKTVKHISKPHVGYNKVLSSKHNDLLLEKYFYMEKRNYPACKLAPWLSSLYWLSKLGKILQLVFRCNRLPEFLRFLQRINIAEKNSINLVIPPSIIIGFDDNRVVYTSRATNALKIKYAKPNYDSKFEVCTAWYLTNDVILHNYRSSSGFRSRQIPWVAS